jgi:ABC-type nitrate/sulfonate/bicarbonate transport system substrate-binding protein
VNNADFLIPRRKFLLGSTGVIAGAVGGSLLHSASAIAQSTPTIPTATVRLACNAYGNHAWVVLAGRKGFLKDVGITLDPPEPKVVLAEQSITQLENSEIDVSTIYLGNVTAAIDKLPNIKPFFIHSFWVGNSILVAPDSGFKTVDEFIAEGLPWEEASRKTMAQLKGVDIVVPPNPSTYQWMNFAYSFAGLKMEDSKVIALEDPKAVQLAISGGVKVASPGGAVQIYQLEHQAGWKLLMGTSQMVKYVKGGAGTTINNLLNYDCMILTQKYLDEHHDTVLRLCSALYRTVDYMFGPEQMTALAEYAPFINANAGSELDASSIKFIYEVLDPFLTWKDQERLWTDKSSPLYYESLYKYQLDALKKAGTIAKKDYDLDDFFQAKKIWTEMNAQKTKADELTTKVKSGGKLSSERQRLVDAAQAQYKGYNFLDAVRFLEAALA